MTHRGHDVKIQGKYAGVEFEASGYCRDCEEAFFL